MKPEVLARYTGYKEFCCPWHQHFMKQVAAYLEPGCIELKNISRMVRIVPETADYVYGDYTPLKTLYEPDSRPTLEAIAQFETIGATTDIEKAKRLCDYINREVFRPAPNHFEWPGGYSYYGGTEEEIIARKSKVCNDLARVFCALCQTLGIPARILYNMHVLAEAYVGGKWAVFDLNYALYYPHSGGTLASAWDIQRDRSILEKHPRFHSLHANYHKYYHKLNAVVNYFVWDSFTPEEMKVWRRSAEDHRRTCSAENRGYNLLPCPVTGYDEGPQK